MSKEMRKQIDKVKNWKQFLNEGKMSKLDAFYRLINVRDTGIVDNDLGYSREFWKWLDSDEAIDIINILGDDDFIMIRDKEKNNEFFINKYS